MWRCRSRPLKSTVSNSRLPSFQKSAGGSLPPQTADCFAALAATRGRSEVTRCEDFALARSEHPGEEEALQQFDAEDFDLALVNRVLNTEGRDAVDRSSLARALVDLGVALRSEDSADPKTLLAASVLFAVNPKKHMPGASVQFVRRTGVGPGPGPVQVRSEIAGPLPLVVDRCLEMVSEHTLQFETVVGVKRQTVGEYPHAVLREAVLNALAHRDYCLAGATVDITVWDDRIEITSPGPLPGHITVDNMQAEHYSRNRRIMGVLKTMGLVEEYGDGVDRMIQEMASRLMEPPAFHASPDSVTVTLRNHALVSVEDQVWLQLFADHTMTIEERRTLVAARASGSITPRRLRSMMPDIDVSAVLAGATAKGLLTRIGIRGGARYVLSDELVLRAGTTGIEARSRQQQILLDQMERRGSISTVEGVELLDEPMPVVRDLLNNLVRANLARSHGRTRARRYHLAD